MSKAEMMHKDSHHKQSHGLDSAIYNLFLSLTSLQILMLLGQNASSTSFHINYCLFYLYEINQK
jgi:aminoglycoside N3'-acetyltransferase